MESLALSLCGFSVVLIFFWKWYYNKIFVNTKLFNKYVVLNKKYKLTRIFSILICLIFLALVIWLRWSSAIINCIDDNLINKAPSEYRSANLSGAFLLDLCSLLGILILVLKIFDNKYKLFLRPLSYLALLGGAATMLATVPDQYASHNWDAYYFFFSNKTWGLGDSEEPLMFLMHWWMIVIGLNEIVWGKKPNIRDISIIITFALLYALYIYLVSSNLNIYSHVTAMVKGDFDLMDSSYYDTQWAIAPGHPGYAVFKDIYGISDWKVAAAVSWITFTVFVIIMVVLKTLSCNLFNNEVIIIDNSKINY